MSTQTVIAVKWKENGYYEVFYYYGPDSPQLLGAELACGIRMAIPISKLMGSLGGSLEGKGGFVDRIDDIYPAMQKDLEWIYAIEEATDPAQTRLIIFGTSPRPGFELAWPIWFSQACHLPHENGIRQIMDGVNAMKDKAGRLNSLHTPQDFDDLGRHENRRFTEGLQQCLSKGPLGERQETLIALIKGLLPVLNQETYTIDRETLKAILKLQECCRQTACGDRTFVSGGPGGSGTLFTVVLGKTIGEDGRKSSFGFAFLPAWKTKWAYCGGFVSDAIRRLNDEKVRDTARRLSQMILLLDKTFDNPRGTIRRLAGKIQDVRELACTF